jgi:hypothetical protein
MKFFLFRYEEAGRTLLAFIKAASRWDAEDAGDRTLGDMTFVSEWSAANGLNAAKGYPGAGMFMIDPTGMEGDLRFLLPQGQIQTGGSPKMDSFFGTDGSVFNPNDFELPLPGMGQENLTSAWDTVAKDSLEFQKSQFLRGLGDRGVGISGIAGKQRREAFEPTFNRFLFENYFNTPGFDPANPEAVGQPRLAEFARTSPLFGRGANQQALGQFQQAVNTSRGLNPLGTGFDALTTGQQDILNPQSAGQAGILSSLANQAARARYGVGAEFLGNRDFGSEFFGQGRNQAQSFADFLNQRIFGG